MFHQTLPGFVEIICGSMFSGKTEELMRRLKRAQYGRQKIQVFKPQIDNRYSAEHVQSHDANRIIAKPIEKARDILKFVDDNTRVVGIDEVQFFDDSVIEVVQKLAYRGVRVICAGLDMDFRGLPFGPVPKLLAVAESVTKLSAVCVRCGAPATRSQRVSAPAGSEGAKVVVGATDHYEARCRICHEPEGEMQLPLGLKTAIQPTESEKIILAAQQLSET